jgi:soluble lytic murein transglycosylase
MEVYGRMFPRLLTAMLVLAVMLCGTGISPACADIYRHVDANGVVFFTNAPQYTKVTDKREWSFYRAERQPGVSSAGNPQLIHAYKDIIRHYANSYRLEEALVKAVIKAESNYNPQAVSRKGARGLMQLIPETARQMRVNDPFDPMQNIRGGSNYLRLMLDQFNGNVDLALAAYNAGPNAVQRHGGIPPFEETRTYVQRVRRYLDLYRRAGDAVL